MQEPIITCNCRRAPISNLWFWLTPRDRHTRLTHTQRRNLNRNSAFHSKAS